MDARTRSGIEGAVAQKAIIIGAGPAGLTAALELLRQTEIQPVVLEATEEIGGISRTIRYKGNRMDIGGHRFFSKSDRVMQWWMDLMPPEASGEAPTGVEISYQGKRHQVKVPARLPEHPPLRGMGAKRRAASLRGTSRTATSLKTMRRWARRWRMSRRWWTRCSRPASRRTAIT